MFNTMRRIVLFSTPYNNNNFHEILNLIFPSNMKDKRPLFMPSQGLSKKKEDLVFLNMINERCKDAGLKIIKFSSTTSFLGGVLHV